MRTLEFAIVFAVTLSLVFSSTPQVFGGGNGCSDPHPSSASDIGPPQTPRFVCNGGGVDTWFIPDDAQLGDPSPGESDGRVPIEFVPGAGPWVKHLQIDALDIFIGLVVPGYTDQLREFLIVNAPTPEQEWTDWHEEIMNQTLNEEWIFTTVSITTFPPSTVTFQNIANTTEVWVDFDPPLQNGTTVDIIKTLEYVGPNPITLQTTQQFIEVHQFPTVPAPPPPRPVGGELLSIDNTALMLAGLQNSAIWILPVLAGVAGSAFGVLYIKSRRN